MSSFEIKEVEILSLKEVKKIMPENFQHLALKDAQAGPQPKDTVIIGSLIDVVRKRTNTSENALMKCICEEVVTNGPLLSFEIFIYNNYITLFDELVAKSGGFPSWVLFSNVIINTYTGRKEPWSPFTLKVLDKDDSPAITLVYQSKKVSRLCIDYTSLNEVSNGNRHNVFVIVKEVVKPTTTLTNGSKHTMLALIDPSCLEDSAERPDLLLHIFFNDRKDRFPEPIEVNDVLRIRSMVGEYFKKDEKLHGKIYNSNAVTKFSYSEDDDDKMIIPVTSHSNYELTEQDIAKVRSLRQWWMRVKVEEVSEREESPPDKLNDSILKTKAIDEITEPSTFTIYCVVRGVRIIENHEIVILRVADGSTSQIYTTTVTFDSATQELCSQTDNVVFGSKQIDIAVFQPLFKDASKIKPGEYIGLVNVSCVNILEGTSDEKDFPVLDFLMNSQMCRITKLYPQCNRARKLKRRLEGQEASEGNQSKDDVIMLAENIQSSTGVKDCPLSNGTNECEDDENATKSDGNVRAIYTTPTKLKESSVEHEKAIRNTTRSREKKRPPANSDENMPSTSGIGKSINTINTTSQGDDDEQTRGEVSKEDVPLYTALQEDLDLEWSSTLEDSEVQSCLEKTPEVANKFRSTVKRNLEADCNDVLETRDTKIRKYAWGQRDVHTECSLFPKSSLTEFCNNSKAGDKGRVWALLKHIHFTSEKPFNDCKCVTCFHDWVWGLCTACGYSFSPSELREGYSKEDLLTKASLACTNACCSAHASLPEGSDQANTAKQTLTATVVPYIKLELCLEDLTNDNEFCVDLNGDGAELFFGITPSFQWTIGSATIPLQKATLLLQHSVQMRPLQFCLMNVPHSDGTSNSIQICATVLKQFNCC